MRSAVKPIIREVDRQDRKQPVSLDFQSTNEPGSTNQLSRCKHTKKRSPIRHPKVESQLRRPNWRRCHQICNPNRLFEAKPATRSASWSKNRYRDRNSCQDMPPLKTLTLKCTHSKYLCATCVRATLCVCIQVGGERCSREWCRPRLAKDIDSPEVSRAECGKIS